MLQRYFADVDIANNGQEAIDLLKKDRKTYIAIFLDISMPVWSELLPLLPWYSHLIHIGNGRYSVRKDHSNHPKI